MKIATHEIGVTGLSFVHGLSKEALTALLHEPNNPLFSWRAKSNINMQFSLEREFDHSFLVRVMGEITLACTCVRCLAEMEFTTELNLAARLLEMEHLGLDDDVSMWQSESIDIDLTAEDDQNISYFKDKTLDLGIVVRDQIFLLVPDYPHCDMGKDALQASRCKVLSSGSGDAHQLKDNPFVKKFGQNKKSK